MNDESPKFDTEAVSAVPAPPRARVSDVAPPDETPQDKLARKRDYLDGFLAAAPPGDTSAFPRRARPFVLPCSCSSRLQQTATDQRVHTLRPCTCLPILPPCTYCTHLLRCSTLLRPFLLHKSGKLHARSRDAHAHHEHK